MSMVSTTMPLSFAHSAQQLADDVLARHAANVDREARFPAEGLRALAAERLLGLTRRGRARRPRRGAARLRRRRRGAGARLRLDGDDLRHAHHRHAGDRGLDARRSRRRPRADRARRAPDDAGAVGEGLALAVLGAGVAAARARRRLRHDGGQVVGDVGERGRLVRRRARRSRTRSRRWSRRSTWRAPQSDAVRPQPGFDGLGLRGNDSAPVSLEELPVGKSRPHDRAGQGRRHDAAGHPAVVRRRHRGDGARPVPRVGGGDGGAPVVDDVRARRQGAARPAAAARAPGRDERAHRGVALAARAHARRDGSGQRRGAAVRAVGAQAGARRPRST